MTLDKDFNNLQLDNFLVIKEIGKGAFGRVMMIQDSDTQEYYAMKITSNKVKKEADLLFYEYTLLSQHFIDNTAFPSLLPKVAKSFKRTEKETFLIMEYFEETLDQRAVKGQVKSFGLQILNIIEYIHNKKYLYIDIKPENFMFKSKNDENVKIIDFGLCQKYVDYKGRHIPSKTLSNPVGTDLYSSIRMMTGTQSGRIDDIECIGYLLLYLCNGQLPWSKLSFDEILTMKKNVSTLVEVPDYIREFIMSSQGYSFDSKPNYNQFKAILMD